MVLESFVRFAKDVINAAKKGGLPQKDLGKLDRLLEKNGKKNAVLAAGLVSALKIGATDEEVKRVGVLFDNASSRISGGKKPFTKKEEDELRKILKGAGISEKTSHWVSKHVDELLADEIKGFILGGSIERGIVPTRKAVKFEPEIKKKKPKKKLSLG